VWVKGIVGFRVMHNERGVREPGRPGLAEEFDLEPVLVAGANGYPGAWEFFGADSPVAEGVRE
jgi:hypothetical protein